MTNGFVRAIQVWIYDRVLYLPCFDGEKPKNLFKKHCSMYLYLCKSSFTKTSWWQTTTRLQILRYFWSKYCIGMKSGCSLPFNYWKTELITLFWKAESKTTEAAATVHNVHSWREEARLPKLEACRKGPLDHGPGFRPLNRQSWLMPGFLWEGSAQLRLEKQNKRMNTQHTWRLEKCAGCRSRKE